MTKNVKVISNQNAKTANVSHNGSHVIINGRLSYNIKTDTYKNLESYVSIFDNVVVETSPENITHATVDDITVTTSHDVYRDNFAINVKNTLFSTHTLEPMNDSTYMVHINKYLHFFDHGFIISKTKDIPHMKVMIKHMESFESDEYCVYYCDTNTIDFSNDQSFVVYSYKNHIYIAQTTYPYRIFAHNELYFKRISYIHVNGDVMAITHDNNVSIFKLPI